MFKHQWTIVRNPSFKPVRSSNFVSEHMLSQGLRLEPVPLDTMSSGFGEMAIEDHYDPWLDENEHAFSNPPYFSFRQDFNE